MRFAIAGCIFSVRSWSSFWGFGAPAKKRPQRRARITSVHFFHAKNRKVLLRFGTISRTWHNFSKDQLLWTNRPRIRAVFLPNSAVCWDLACVFHVARFEPFWNVRVLVDRFAVQKMPPAESEYRWSGTKKREKKRCLDRWRMHRTERYARKYVCSVRKKKKLLHHGIFHNWVRQETAEIHVPSSRFENAKKAKNIKKCNSRIGSEAECGPSAGCQNEGPKNELDECTVRFVAAQLPTGSVFTSVACGPDSPRPKDCPGLGDPNTLKLLCCFCCYWYLLLLFLLWFVIGICHTNLLFVMVICHCHCHCSSTCLFVIVVVNVIVNLSFRL